MRSTSIRSNRFQLSLGKVVLHDIKQRGCQAFTEVFAGFLLIPSRKMLHASVVPKLTVSRVLQDSGRGNSGKKISLRHSTRQKARDFERPIVRLWIVVLVEKAGEFLIGSGRPSLADPHYPEIDLRLDRCRFELDRLAEVSDCPVEISF
ncbi:MAG: hypothetical protein JO331_02820 [Verrucomicrobia bacterium]|nr:hypothetical protein [Verrucomicrobiota bacterium]